MKKAWTNLFGDDLDVDLEEEEDEE